MYKAIVFDVDGTLIDTERSIIMGLRELLNEKNNDKYSDKELDFVLGIPGEAAIKKFDFENPEQCLIKWNEYIDNLKDYNAVFPEIVEVLKLLKSRNIIIGIVTSRTKAECDSDSAFLSIQKYFHHIVCADDTKLHKPNGEPLKKFLNDIQAKSSEIIYIGDTIYDYECACDARVEFLWAGWGTKENINFDTSNVIMRPDEIINYI